MRTYGWHSWEIRSISNCNLLFISIFIGGSTAKQKSPKESLSQCCTRFWSHCLGGCLRTWLPEWLILLLSMELLTLLSYAFWNRVCLHKVIGKKISVIKFSQNKLTKLVFCYYSFCSWLASKSHSAINPPKLKAMHHQSFYFLQMETLFAQINIDWIPGIHLISHFGFFHSEELDLSWLRCNRKQCRDTRQLIQEWQHLEQKTSKSG